MNRKLFCAVLALTLLLTGCAQPANDAISDDNASGTPAQLLDNAAEQCDLLPLRSDLSESSASLVLLPNAVNALRAVLRGEASFYSIDLEQALDLPHFLAHCAAQYEEDTVLQTLTTLEFSLIDSGDALCVAVSLGAHRGETLGTLILHYFADTVYGTILQPSAALPAELRADGTFPNSTGTGWSILAPDAQHCAIAQYLRAGDTHRYLNGLPIETQLYDDLAARQESSAPAQWYTLTNATIDTVLPAEETAVDPYAVVFTAFAEAAPAEESDASARYSDYFAARTAALERTSTPYGYSYISAASLFTRPNLLRIDATEDETIAWSVRYFSLLDLDGDGSSELILAATSGSICEYSIYTCDGDTLYVNTLNERSFLSPRADGTFSFSSGAYDNGFARAQFTEGELTLSEFAVRQGERYTIDGKAVTEEEYASFCAQQNEKEALAWITFSPENLARVFGSESIGDGVASLREPALSRVLTYPADWNETAVISVGSGETGAGGEIMLFTLSEKCAYTYYDGNAGCVWSIYALSLDSFRYWFSEDFRIDWVIGSAKYVIGADDAYVYFLTLATDVQYLEDDAVSRAQYEALQSASQPVIANFLALNRIEPNEKCPANEVYHP